LLKSFHGGEAFGATSERRCRRDKEIGRRSCANDRPAEKLIELGASQAVGRLIKIVLARGMSRPFSTIVVPQVHRFIGIISESRFRVLFRPQLAVGTPARALGTSSRTMARANRSIRHDVNEEPAVASKFGFDGALHQTLLERGRRRSRMADGRAGGVR